MRLDPPSYDPPFPILAQPTIRQNAEQFAPILDWHVSVCGVEFDRYRASNWMVCQKGAHTYWTLDGAFWYRFEMRW